MIACPNCGELNPERFRLCGFCGTPLIAAPPPEEVRKVVTVVFSDLKGSTDLGERLDSESLRDVMSRYFDAMREPLEAHGGTIEKFIGDAVMAVFGLPRLHEDDALRAVRAAAAMQAQLASLNDELERRYGVRLANRTGVNTGEVVAGDPLAGQRLVTGDAVNVAARLEQAAPAGAVLIGPITHRLVREYVDAEPLAPLTLKGKSEPVPAFRLVAIREARRVQRRGTPLVGREAELEEMRRAFAAARADGVARLLTLIAPAGTGKSRLTEEFARHAAASARVLRCRCKSYGRGITFWPLAELVRAAAGIGDSDPPELALERLARLAGDKSEAIVRRVAAAIGISSESFHVDELFWGARKLLEHLATERPLVVICDDVHWAELTFLDLLEHVADSAQAPILLIATAREDVLELRPDWSEGPHASRLALQALSRDDTGRVLAGLLGGASIPEAARARIIEASDGNPLFAEQLVSMLVDDGLLKRRDGRWTTTADLAELAIPPTIHALLAARLDQLPREERGILEPASVIGLEFEVAGVRALVDEPARPGIERRLPHLARKQLIRAISGDGTFRFHHGLIRDAAYHRLLKRARAVLHERFVTWARERYLTHDRRDELEEILGYHLEQAHRYLLELGPLDDHGRALGAEAAKRLSTAGRSAFARGDMPAAANLLRRGVTLLDHDDPDRLTLLPSLGEAFAEIGEFALAEVYLEQAIARPGAADGPTAALCALLRLHVRAQSGGGEEDWGDRIVGVAETTIPLLEASGDLVGAATACRVAAWAHGTAGRFGKTAEAAERAVELATAAGDDRQRRRASSQYAQAALYGPTPAPEAIVRCEQILAQATGDHRTLGLVRGVLSRLVAMRGDIEPARALYRGAQRALAEAGRSVVASTSLFSCGVEMLAGNPAAAERELRRDFEALSAVGETYLRSTLAGELVRALLAQGRDEEARHFSAVAEELAADDDVTSQALWRAGRARLLARAGEPERAAELAREAVALIEDTDALIDRAEMLSDQAEVLARAGDAAGAADAAAAALALHRRKGNLMAAEALRLAPATASGRCGPGPVPP